MKNWTLFLLAFIPAIVFAQPTTQEEYNYVTKGLKIQKESGLDMKKGYSLRDYGIKTSGTVNVGNALTNTYVTATVSSFGLYRDGQDKPCAVLIIYDRPGLSEYLCVPSFDADKAIWNLHLARVADYRPEAKHVVMECMIRTLSFFGTKHGG